MAQTNRATNKAEKSNGISEMDEFSERIAAQAHNAIDSALEREQRVSAQLKDVVDKTEQKSALAKQAVTNYIEEKPIVALGIAALAGFALSSILRMKH